jgi:hypothetical protein
VEGLWKFWANLLLHLLLFSGLSGGVLVCQPIGPGSISGYVMGYISDEIKFALSDM